jgi:hypothetical protein
MPGLFDPGSFRANGFPRTDISGNSSIAPVRCVRGYPYRTGAMLSFREPSLSEGG